MADEYVALELERGVVSEGTLQRRKKVIRRFLAFLEGRGHQTFDTVVADDIRAFLVDLKQRQPKGIIATLPMIRRFCMQLNEKQIFAQEWGKILSVKMPPSKPIRLAFTKSETERLLAAPDRSTPIGMRDYAVMLLAARTGLRAVDIFGLKLSDVDWRSHEISTIQRKTGRPLSLPLFPDVGNAIAEYILHGRPKVDRDHIFLSSQSPYYKMADQTSTVVERNLKKAGFSKKARLKKGFHSFRRAVGTQMLEAEVPIETISQVLGHSSTEATKPYLGIDLAHLKECALDLSAFPCLRGELC
jgi:site-specific recombinase XerD